MEIIIRHNQNGTFIIFPTDLADFNFNCTVLTAHGHTAGNYEHMINNSVKVRRDTPEFKQAMQILKDFGYDLRGLRIMQRRSSKMYDEFLARYYALIGSK